MRYLLLVFMIFAASLAAADEVSIAQFTEAIAQAPPDSRHKFYQYRARAYAKQNLLREALADLGAAIKLNPTLSAHRERGEILMRLGRYREAVADLDLVVKANPDELGLYRLRSKACFESGLYQRALHDANLVLAKQPDDAECRQIVMQSTTALSPEKEIVMPSSHARRRAAPPGNRAAVTAQLRKAVVTAPKAISGGSRTVRKS